MKSTRSEQFDSIFNMYAMLGGADPANLYDVKEQVSRFSPALVELVGLSGEYMSDGAYNWMDHVHPDDRAIYTAAMNGIIACRQQSYDLTYRVRIKDGTYHSFRFVGGVIKDAEGNPDFIGGVMLSNEIAGAVDPITGMRNQRAFFDDLAQSADNTAKQNILLIGIGRLNNINEEYGYGHGNDTLTQTGRRIQEMVGQAGTVYRMDGPEFSILSTQLEKSELRDLYEKISGDLYDGIIVNGVSHRLTVFGGLLARSENAELGGKAIYHNLKKACIESEQSKRGELVTVNEIDTNHNAYAVVEAVLQSMANEFNNFYLLYQPIYGVDTEKPIGAEALLRWKNAKFGEVLPLTFLSEVERESSFIELGYWILRNVMKDGMAFIDSFPDFIICMNVSPRQAHDLYFCERVAEIAAQIGFPLDHLYLEFTRDCRLLKIDTLRAVTVSLHDKGVRVGIDDYGEGNAWLEALKELGADYVKFSDELVRSAAQSDAGQNTVKYLTELAASYNAEVYAKSVESEKAVNVLHSLPVKGMQGRFLSLPVYFDEIIDVLEEI